MRPRDIEEPTDELDDEEGEEIEVDASGSFDTYLEYNKVLRTWFVAFGVGLLCSWSMTGLPVALVRTSFASRQRSSSSEPAHKSSAPSSTRLRTGTFGAHTTTKS